MKKAVALIIVLVLMTTTVFAVDIKPFMEIEEERSVNRLKELELIPHDYETEGNATRIECLTMLTSIYNTNDDEWDINVAESYLEDYSDADKLKNDTELCAAAKMTAFGILKGSVDDEKIYINPDAEITWREMLLFSLRFCESEYSFYYEGDDEAIMERGYEKGLLYGELIFWTNIFDKPVTKSELCTVMNRVLHAPIRHHSYGGNYISYYIDFFLEKSDISE